MVVYGSNALNAESFTDENNKADKDKNMNEIEINGEIYVKKSTLLESQSVLSDYCIVRTYSAGVFAGYIESKEGQHVIMRSARRLWYWDGASSLSQLAMEGTNKPENCKFPCEVERVELLEAIEILNVTTKAEKSIKGVAIWHQ